MLRRLAAECDYVGFASLLLVLGKKIWERFWPDTIIPLPTSSLCTNSSYPNQTPDLTLAPVFRHLHQNPQPVRGSSHVTVSFSLAAAPSPSTNSKYSRRSL
ncbi:hypothetical protein DPEC_G00112520 [Dallia pectoralis]|uniref:Uncharacterized protein n=1 Tax=Dallia pectoralis TaxID=75939 RepID=A0ACC2GU17_DALPE|nr:hypothetical protein DPEC_G00112520 [Dallia pectoralis]